MERMIAAEPRSSDRILNKALELFSNRGYEATSVREICEAAGITKPTLYHFYGSKEGVYRALVDGTLEAFQRDLVRDLDAPGAPAGEKLRRVARSYFENARQNRELMRFILGLVHNPSTTAPLTDFPRFYEHVVGQIARCVDDGVAAGEFAPGPSEVRLLVFMGALGESLCGNVIVGRPDLTPELADALVETVISGWRPVAKA
jgi:AcrR family transcriptional regulator